jgi:hypothetical protein
VEQGLAQQAMDRGPPHGLYHGEYQIGDVNARSWVVNGTFGSILTLK